MSTPVPATLTVEFHLDAADMAAALRDDARRGMAAQPKELPPKWFYDDRGSELFDEITRLPEYYPTRREREILEQRADEIAALSGADTLVGHDRPAARRLRARRVVEVVRAVRRE